MKEIYVKPKSDVEKFKTIDVITTSDDGDNEPDTDIKVPWS
jgi:hypothetical protein